ncbi:MAG TPA: hypothetical protein ENI69_00365 [Rhodospirillales bacterium]|nr:hypothetical protein [Rhodospirillales bacterium]
MAISVSFEIYSFKNGNWMLDSVHDDKNMAIHQSRMLISSPHHIAVRVIEESYDDDADRSFSKIIYKEQKGKEENKPKKQVSKKKKGSGSAGTVKKKKKKKKGSFSSSMIILVISVGGIGIGLLALVAVMIAKFG